MPRLKIPYVVEPIGMFVPIVRNLWLKRFYHRLWGKRMLAGAAAVVATAEQEVEELAAGGIARSRITLRRNGVMLPPEMPAAGRFRAKHNIRAESWLVLFLGRLSSKKSPDMLLEAFAKLSPVIAGREVCLAFAGPDESGMRSRLEELAKLRGVQERTVFSGAIFDEEKWAAYCDASVFVLPSQNENFGNTAVEAAACGTPVVISENCGVAPLLADIAGIVVPHQIEALARAVEQILSDGELRTQLSGAAVSWPSDWGEEPVVAMENLYVGPQRDPSSLDNLQGQPAMSDLGKDTFSNPVAQCECRTGGDGAGSGVFRAGVFRSPISRWLRRRDHWRTPRPSNKSNPFCIDAQRTAAPRIPRLPA
jgi:glycosyltransferase involved in cell wall biosynthesis